MVVGPRVEIVKRVVGVGPRVVGAAADFAQDVPPCDQAVFASAMPYSTVGCDRIYIMCWAGVRLCVVCATSYLSQLDSMFFIWCKCRAASSHSSLRTV